MLIIFNVLILFYNFYGIFRQVEEKKIPWPAREVETSNE